MENLIPQSQRCGIYVLHMSDDTFYVGQAKNVIRRYHEHCRSYQHIEHVSFKRVYQKNLNTEEENAIRTLETRGFHLLNIIHASITYKSTDFDLLVPPDKQKRWIADLSWSYAGNDRHDKDYEKQRLKYQHRFEQFRGMANYQETVSVLRQYVQGCIPSFKSTQFEYWCISCLPATLNNARYATVNLNTMETFVVGKGGWSFINIAQTHFREAYPQDNDFSRKYPDTSIQSSH